jgi:hypothetical protein
VNSVMWKEVNLSLHFLRSMNSKLRQTKLTMKGENI